MTRDETPPRPAGLKGKSKEEGENGGKKGRDGGGWNARACMPAYTAGKGPTEAKEAREWAWGGERGRCWRGRAGIVCPGEFSSVCAQLGG